MYVCSRCDHTHTFIGSLQLFANVYFKRKKKKKTNPAVGN